MRLFVLPGDPREAMIPEGITETELREESKLEMKLLWPPAHGQPLEGCAVCSRALGGPRCEGWVGSPQREGRGETQQGRVSRQREWSPAPYGVKRPHRIRLKDTRQILGGPGSRAGLGWAGSPPVPPPST